MIRSAEWLFVDTSAFIALCAGDRYHEAAELLHWSIYGASEFRCSLRISCSRVCAYFCEAHGDAIAVGAAIQSKALRYRPDCDRKLPGSCTEVQ